MSDTPKLVIEWALHKKEDCWKSKTHGFEIRMSEAKSQSTPFELIYVRKYKGTNNHLCRRCGTLSEAKEEAVELAVRMDFKP